MSDCESRALFSLHSYHAQFHLTMYLLLVRSQGTNGFRTTPHEDNSPPDKNKAQPLPTRHNP